MTSALHRWSPSIARLWQRGRSQRQIVFVVQRGRLEREAILLVASALANGRVRPDELVACHPEPGPGWPDDPRPGPATLGYLAERGVATRSFVNADFGARYPHSNKMYALAKCAAPSALFLDTDTFFVRPIARRLSARAFYLRRGGQTFPNRETGHSAEAIWTALYDKFGATPVAPARRGRNALPGQFPYYNAGAIGAPDPAGFGRTFLDTALAIERDPPPELAGQKLFPWLDQIALPIAIARVGGTVRRFDDGINRSGTGKGVALWHYHYLPRLVFEGGPAFGKAVTRVLADPAVREALAGDPMFALWTGTEGRRRYNAVAGDAPLAGRQLVRALKDSAGREILR
ncbi:hypothetical protein [Acuticoccus sp.]|uniref:hypothetical protein n=1 Tax=Acuticoccus sp. TaxID=1904378 RepID=UPI003B51AD2C